MKNDNRNSYAQVLVDIPSLHVRTFSYTIPDELKDKIKTGSPVFVPFGTMGVINGYVVGFSNYLPDGIKAKSIYEILDDEPVFDLEYLQFMEWISGYYCSDLPTVISAALPVNFLSKAKKIVVLKNIKSDKLLTKQEEKILEVLREKNPCSLSTLQKKVKEPSSKFYEAMRKLGQKGIIEIENELERISKKHKMEKSVILLDKNSENKRYSEILEIIHSSGGKIKHSELVKLAKTSPDTIKRLSTSGNILIQEEEIYRDPLNIFKNRDSDSFHDLNFAQNESYQRIKTAIENQDSEPLLLFGITGSGKTEVYFHAARHALEMGKNVIFLAPEIPLASMLAGLISQRFGAENVALWHSNMSEGEKYDVWQKIRRNEIKIIVGARSAIFAPIKNLGLIVIDEEHESSYKQTSPAPRYNAKELARERAARTGAALVMGSATPDISTYYRAINSNRVLLLPERFGSRDLAGVRIIDMCQEIFRGRKSIFSAALKRSIEKNLENKKQTILLINRRGFSTQIFCPSCGYVAECRKCSIPLILHKTNNRLRCHYCSYEQNLLSECPQCSSGIIKYYGMGTQRVEEEFIREFPSARASRMDSDVLSRKNAHIDIIESFTRGEIDVLIGTQMIAKGLNIANVTLVGVLMSDSLFNIPDYRASERGFQLLTQVAGRAGRGDFNGIVYFQTHTPEFYALQFAKEQDYLSFYSSEIQSRYEFSYPPYSQLTRLILSSENQIRTEKMANETAFRLKNITEREGISEKLEVLGPTPCIISKIKDEFRFQILIKNRLEQKGATIVSSFLRELKIPEDIKFLVDVDPVEML